MKKNNKLLLVLIFFNASLYGMFTITFQPSSPTSFVSGGSGPLDVSFQNNNGLVFPDINLLAPLVSPVKFQVGSFTLRGSSPDTDTPVMQRWNNFQFLAGESEDASGINVAQIVFSPTIGLEFYQAIPGGTTSQTFLVVPDASYYQASTLEDTQLTFDGTFGGLALTPNMITVQSNGTAMISGTDILFDPTPGFVGMASFTYTAISGLDGSTVTITITITVIQDQTLVSPNEFIQAYKNKYCN